MTILGDISLPEISTPHGPISEKDDDAPSLLTDKQNSKPGDVSTWLLTLLSALPENKPAIQVFAQLMPPDLKLHKASEPTTASDPGESPVPCLAPSKANLAFALRLTPKFIASESQVAIPPRATGSEPTLDKTTEYTAIAQALNSRLSPLETIAALTRMTPQVRASDSKTVIIPQVAGAEPASDKTMEGTAIAQAADPFLSPLKANMAFAPQLLTSQATATESIAVILPQVTETDSTAIGQAVDSSLSLPKENLTFDARLTQPTDPESKGVIPPPSTATGPIFANTVPGTIIGQVGLQFERPAERRGGTSIVVAPAQSSRGVTQSQVRGASTTGESVGLTIPVQELAEPSPHESAPMTSREDEAPTTVSDPSNKERGNNAPLRQSSSEHAATASDPRGIVTEGTGLIHTSGESKVSTESAQTRKPEFQSDTNPGFHPPQAREILLKIPGADANAIELRITDRAGKVQVSVRSTDVDLTESLRTNLGDLIGRLEDSGFDTEVMTPTVRGIVPSGTLEHPGMGQPDGHSRGDTGHEQRPRNRQRRSEASKVFSLREKGGAPE